MSQTPPRIGQHWPEQGGIYAGIVAGRDGQPDYHLIVSTEEHELPDQPWGPYGKHIEGADSYHDGAANTAAMATAELELATKVKAITIDGHTDWHIPSQAEAHLMAANLNEQMPAAWYWTSTQYGANYAWLQSFSYGYTYLFTKDYYYRCRPVRRSFL